MKNRMRFLSGFMVRFLVMLAVCNSAFLASPSFAKSEENDMKEMNTTQLVEVYNRLETELLRRFEQQKKENSPDLSDTINTLGHIRSSKAVDLLIENIDIEPEFQNKQAGDFYPVSITKARTLESVYVALYALERIGAVSLDRCITELERAKAGSKQEMLLAKLAYACHGEAFIDRARLLEKSNNEKWQRVLKLSGKR